MKLLFLTIALFVSSPKTDSVKVETSTLSYPCHYLGDLYPCTHPQHSYDIGPCMHFDYYGNRIHSADMYTCTHPMHSAGDLGPCTHVCW